MYQFLFRLICYCRGKTHLSMIARTPSHTLVCILVDDHKRAQKIRLLKYIAY